MAVTRSQASPTNTTKQRVAASSTISFSRSFLDNTWHLKSLEEVI
jgi:hypothetical protein